MIVFLMLWLVFSALNCKTQASEIPNKGLEETLPVSSVDLVHIGGLFHDLRGPLATAMMALQIMGKSFVDSECGDLIKDLELFGLVDRRMKEVDRMLVNFLDELEKVGAAEKVPSSVEVVNINDEVKDLLTDISIRYSAFVETDFKSEIATVCNRIAFRRIVENIVVNAIKYGASEHNPRISIRRNEDFFTVSVLNFGKVIPDQELTRIFEPFYQSRSSGTEKFGGHQSGWGLGLSVVRSLVTQMGGRIHVTSSELGGTCFSVTLPIQ
ncbi:MAG: sensor histidine kinase [Bacteriovoracia bacterium]